jgi:DNA-directed RNA polymerase specialized sigma24 family protein
MFNGFSVYDKVIDLLEDGLSEQEVADRLHITLEEVKQREDEFINEIKVELGIPDEPQVRDDKI